ncbi:hypothetical protein CYLTODRAFT_237790 [Cylindrobasidium torrendii FP15055 ss-10]|uniref:Wax synthase domain-containing protein n=1 Tax=Cylindrobasidium torrendii FP15055 ss-10 TaxID=1314674 RepID=A0A0D7BF96_9AGAR|nr:hypothetical protein CYLTODRAFT_237790 [Cylindrobasidium torrendii FP15055 ss-10]
MSCTAPRFGIAPPSVHLDGARPYLTHFVPVQLVYFVGAILITIPNTRPLRLALFPLFLAILWRTTSQLDMSNGVKEDVAMNLGLLSLVMTVFMRTLTWTFRSQPHLRVVKRRDPCERTRWEIICDAADLCSNFRGIGWDWSIYRRDPTITVTKPTSRATFLRQSAFQWFYRSVIFEAILYIALNWPAYEAPNAILDFGLRALRSLCYPAMVFFTLNASYNFYSIIGVGIFRQTPEEWPAFYARPWKSTSLAELWGRDWHQGWRYTFWYIGGKPMSMVFGRVGLVLGAFLASGAYHDALAWGMHRERGNCCWLTPFFVLNGVGLVLEHALYKVTGKRVGGKVGWLWTWAWAIGSILSTYDAECVVELSGSLTACLYTRPIFMIYSIYRAVLSNVA